MGTREEDRQTDLLVFRDFLLDRLIKFFFSGRHMTQDFVKQIDWEWASPYTQSIQPTSHSTETLPYPTSNPGPHTVSFLKLSLSLLVAPSMEQNNLPPLSLPPGSKILPGGIKLFKMLLY